MLIEAGEAESAIGGSGAHAGGRAPAELHNLVSRAYLEAGKVQEAYDALRQATRLEPGAAENYIDLASICVEHDNFDLGLEIVDIGLRQLPESWMLYLQRGVLLAMKARSGEAEKEFEARGGSPRTRPSPTRPWAWPGCRAGKPRRRSRCCGPSVLAATTTSCRTSSRWRSCARGWTPPRPTPRKRWTRCGPRSRPGPTSLPRAAELGRLLFKRDEVELAIAELEKAAELDPAGTPALYALSQAYRRKGERAKAQELLARVSKLNAQERGDDQDGELRRAVFRIVREGTAPPRPAARGP